jgi:hypothetical protein
MIKEKINENENIMIETNEKGMEPQPPHRAVQTSFSFGMKNPAAKYFDLENKYRCRISCDGNSTRQPLSLYMLRKKTNGNHTTPMLGLKEETLNVRQW